MGNACSSPLSCFQAQPSEHTSAGVLELSPEEAAYRELDTPSKTAATRDDDAGSPVTPEAEPRSDAAPNAAHHDAVACRFSVKRGSNPMRESSTSASSHNEEPVEDAQPPLDVESPGTAHSSASSSRFCDRSSSSEASQDSVSSRGPLTAQVLRAVANSAHQSSKATQCSSQSSEQVPLAPARLQLDDDDAPPPDRTVPSTDAFVKAISNGVPPPPTASSSSGSFLSARDSEGVVRETSAPHAFVVSESGTDTSEETEYTNSSEVSLIDERPPTSSYVASGSAVQTVSGHVVSETSHTGSHSTIIVDSANPVTEHSESASHAPGATTASHTESGTTVLRSANGVAAASQSASGATSSQSSSTTTSQSASATTASPLASYAANTASDVRTLATTAQYDSSRSYATTGASDLLAAQRSYATHTTNATSSSSSQS